MKKQDLDNQLTFGFEQTFTVPNWWTDEGFTATSDTPLKREKMLALAQAIAKELNGSYKESVDIWDHMQYETFDQEGKPSFVVTMDPGSIEVKTQPCLAGEASEMAKPLFSAAEAAGVVAYRNWWYGIKGGTEGGCHVNMGGMSAETNPLKIRPDLAVKYSAYVHNRPWLHYPFMGLDTGPEGNAQRMDEKSGFEEVKKAFETYSVDMDADQTYEHFKNTNLIKDKASYPSLFKLKSPLYFIEDRGQEALRAPEEFGLVSNLRLEIMKRLFDTDAPEELQTFDDLHGQVLTSYWLWENFQVWAKEMGMDAAPFMRFFERQFPKLTGGQNVPNTFWLKEGRRPRVIKDIKKRGDTIISKTIDTSYKRFELCCVCDSEPSMKIEGEGIEKTSAWYKHAGAGFGETGQVWYRYIDLKIHANAPVLSLEFGEEKASFNLNDMMWS